MDGFLDPELAGQRPQVRYPCRWSFKLIGADEAELRNAVDAVLGPPGGERDYALSLSNESAHGRWRSMLLELWVQSDDDRHTIGHRLHARAEVKLVL